MRGYFGIGMINHKTPANLGTLWRSAYCLGADFVFTVGARYRPQHSDTTNTPKQIPYWRFDSFEDFARHIPYDCQFVGVELAERARSLETFTHPPRAVYLLGPEDGNIPPRVLKRCVHVVKFDAKHCLNVAAAGTVVLYGRQTKGLASMRRPALEVAG